MVVDKIEKQVLLRCDVIIERTRLQPDTSGKLAQAHCLKAMFMDEIKPRLVDGGEGLHAR